MGPNAPWKWEWFAARWQIRGFQNVLYTNILPIIDQLFSSSKPLFPLAMSESR